MENVRQSMNISMASFNRGGKCSTNLKTYPWHPLIAMENVRQIIITSMVSFNCSGKCSTVKQKIFGKNLSIRIWKNGMTDLLDNSSEQALLAGNWSETSLLEYIY